MLEFLTLSLINFARTKALLDTRLCYTLCCKMVLVEMMNRTLLERAKCMMLEGGAPKRFWGEAVNTAAYLVNRCPLVALDFKILEEVWTGHPPKFDN